MLNTHDSFFKSVSNLEKQQDRQAAAAEKMGKLECG